MDITTNYCGAYWNNGQLRKSRRTYDLQPVNQLDYNCLVHDCDLAIIEEENEGNEEMMSRADTKFYNNVSKLSGLRPIIYSNLVYYGNPLLRMGAKYAKGASDFTKLGNLRSTNDKENAGQNEITGYDDSGRYTCAPLDNYVLRGTNITYDPPVTTKNTPIPSASATESAGLGYRLQQNIPFFKNANLNGKTKRRKKKNKNKW